MLYEIILIVIEYIIKLIFIKPKHKLIALTLASLETKMSRKKKIIQVYLQYHFCEHIMNILRIFHIQNRI